MIEMGDMGDLPMWNDEVRRSSPTHSPTSRADITSLTSKLYTTLPLELRTRIYNYCLQGPSDNEVIVRRSFNNHNPKSNPNHPFTLLIRHPSPPSSYTWSSDPTLPHLLPLLTPHNHQHPTSSTPSPSLIAAELLESYYWTRVFKFSHRDLDLLPAFLSYNWATLGVLPCVYARRLCVQIHPFAVRMRVPESGAGRDGHGAVRRREQEREQGKCEDAIRSLAWIQSSRTEVVVQFELDREAADYSEYAELSTDDEEFLLRLVRELVKLKERGLRV
ncbi:hypothetical protein T440DRAFT_425074, partial [Plenodomus tracheiphilus IPT5]